MVASRFICMVVAFSIEAVKLTVFLKYLSRPMRLRLKHICAAVTRRAGGGGESGAVLKLTGVYGRDRRMSCSRLCEVGVARAA